MVVLGFQKDRASQKTQQNKSTREQQFGIKERVSSSGYRKTNDTIERDNFGEKLNVYGVLKSELV